ncbi:MAG: alpha/beta hydrolase [Saprospiraceae bacterium]|nr:MAG: alpha/beta hydrolase [Saprospiraceae bacterium]
MPIIEKSSYPGPPYWMFNGHLQTIMPAFRRIQFYYERERIATKDGDFLDLDWADSGSRKLLILTHGLEGSSGRPYMMGMAKRFFKEGWDILAWNCRSCSGEMNRKPRLYNHGEIGDIGEVINHALRTKDYQRIVLVGFSMGGSITLKYLGVNGKEIPGPIDRAVAFSSPCDLREGAAALEKWDNAVYRRRFLKSLRTKIEEKARQFEQLVDLDKFNQIRRWRDFDTHFSAPINGYHDVDDFYEKASAKNFMAGITIPSLLVNAQNDPLLNEACSPTDLCSNHQYLHLEKPVTGGHVGFMVANRVHTWSEDRAFQFCS